MMEKKTNPSILLFFYFFPLMGGPNTSILFYSYYRIDQKWMLYENGNCMKKLLNTIRRAVSLFGAKETSNPNMTNIH